MRLKNPRKILLPPPLGLPSSSHSLWLWGRLLRRWRCCVEVDIVVERRYAREIGGGSGGTWSELLWWAVGLKTWKSGLLCGGGEAVVSGRWGNR